jgi:hypothetical protein
MEIPEWKVVHFCVHLTVYSQHLCGEFTLKRTGKMPFDGPPLVRPSPHVTHPSLPFLSPLPLVPNGDLEVVIIYRPQTVLVSSLKPRSLLACATLRRL